MFGFRGRFGAGGKRNGLTGETTTLLELLDLGLLKAESDAASFAGARFELRLKQAQVRRELARRCGDGVALRQAASSAELAARDAPPAIAAPARLEQALCAMDGAELFGDEGLNAAADRVLTPLCSAPGLVGAMAVAKRARIAARQALARGEAMDALACLTGYDVAAGSLKGPASAGALADCRIERAQMTLACARRLDDDRLAARAAADLGEVLARLDQTLRPLTWAEAARLRAEAHTFIGRRNGDVRVLAEAVEQLSRLFDLLLRDHSPLDWARVQLAHGEALWALADVAGIDEALPRAAGAFDRAWGVVRDLPAVKLRAEAGERRGALAVDVAARGGDPLEMDALEAAFRCDLARVEPRKDAVGWALCQLNLGRLYLARDGGPRSRSGPTRSAALALLEAADVFREHGLVGLAETAENSL